MVLWLMLIAVAADAAKLIALVCEVDCEVEGVSHGQQGSVE